MRPMLTSSIMARTTLDLDPSVVRELRRRAADEGKSMGQVASELLVRALAESRDAGGVPSLRWISKDLGVPRVDLEDKEALRALLNERS
jgi:plasmid stability protein